MSDATYQSVEEQICSVMLIHENLLIVAAPKTWFKRSQIIDYPGRLPVPWHLFRRLPNDIVATLVTFHYIVSRPIC